MYRHLLSALLLATLAACASTDVVSQSAPEGYVQNVPARVAGVDWSTAQTVDVTLEGYDFAPDTLTFKAGKPYRLVMHNAGSAEHTFTAPDFFQAIAAQKLVSPDSTVDTPYVQNIVVPAGQTKELYFVAVRPGRYDLECSEPLHALLGMTGTITIS